MMRSRQEISLIWLPLVLSVFLTDPSSQVETQWSLSSPVHAAEGENSVLFPTHMLITEGCLEPYLMSASSLTTPCELGWLEPQLLPAKLYPPEPEESLTSREAQMCLYQLNKGGKLAYVFYTHRQNYSLARWSSWYIYLYLSIYPSIFVGLNWPWQVNLSLTKYLKKRNTTKSKVVSASPSRILKLF